MKPLQKIGITGGIGSGKSTVCKIFEVLGIPVYYADDRAKWLMSNSPNVRERIIQTFGPESYKDNELNRTYLAKIVFSNPAQTKQINAIVHPAVGKDFQLWCDQHEGNYSYILKEAALMFESKSHEALDKVICVSAPESVRIERTLKRDPHRNLEGVRNIIKKQLPEKEKISLSDYLIENDVDSMLIPQVLTLHNELLAL